jgi:hypothetical protein
MDRSAILTVVLQNAESEHVGWVLWHPHLGADTGNCAFLPLPTNPKLLGTPAVEALYDRQQAGQSAWRVSRTDPLTVVITTPGLLEEMFVEFRLGGTSVWGLGGGDEQREVGIVRPANCYQQRQAELDGPADGGGM